MADTIPGSTATKAVLTVNGPRVSSAIDDMDDGDWWKIYLEANKYYLISTQTVRPSGLWGRYTNIDLINSNGVKIYSETHNITEIQNNTQLNIQDNQLYKINLSGYYYVQISENNLINNYDYKLTASTPSGFLIKINKNYVEEGGSATIEITRKYYGQATDILYYYFGKKNSMDSTSFIKDATIEPSNKFSDYIVFNPGEISKIIKINTIDDKIIEGMESLYINFLSKTSIYTNEVELQIKDNEFDDIPGDKSTTHELRANGEKNYGNIDGPEDQDWYKVTLKANIKYIFNQYKEENKGQGCYLTLKDKDGHQIDAGTSIDRNHDSVMRFAPSASDTYYVSASGSIGKYSIKLEAEKPLIYIKRDPGTISTVVTEKEGTPFKFTLIRSNGEGTSSVDYTVAFDSQLGLFPTSPSDFNIKYDANGLPVAPSGTVTFQPGQTSQTITINVNNDSTIEYDEMFSVTLSNPVNAGIGNNSALGIVKDNDVATKKYADIFRAEGSVNNDGSTDGIFNAGKMRVMADFSKAAYALQSWETATAVGRAINDVSPGADAAYNSLIKQGWVPLDVAPTIPKTSLAVNNQMAGGYYTCGNAAALVMRCGDAVVISFRGTNDNAPQYSPNENKYDKQNIYHPDADQWGALQDGSSQSMTDHYNLFKNLLDSFDGYLNQNLSNLTKVFVTGHSLGGAMAIKYMSEHQHNIFESITYAAPSFTISDWLPQMFSKDTRITQVAIDEDPVPATWGAQRVIFGTYPPGRVITFYGTKTADEPDSQTGLGYVNIDNHSMDYYRQITKSVSSGGWQQILQGNNDRNVLIGATSGPYFNVEPKRHDPTQPGDQFDNIFVVDGTNSSNGAFSALLSNDEMPSNNYVDFYYGGVGNDAIRDSPGSDTIYAGSGNDFIEAKKEGLSDTIYTGTGKDIIKFYNTTNLLDNIMDFTSKTDQIQVVSANFGNIAPGVLSTSNFVAGVNPVARNTDPTFLFDKATGNLIFDSNGSATGGQSVLAHFEGAGVLSGTDILVVKS